MRQLTRLVVLVLILKCLLDLLVDLAIITILKSIKIIFNKTAYKLTNHSQPYFELLSMSGEDQFMGNYYSELYNVSARRRLNSDRQTQFKYKISG